MQKEDVYETLKDKLVLGENISQTASFVVSGSADVGVVALSLALSPNMKDRGRYVEMSKSLKMNIRPSNKRACFKLVEKQAAGPSIFVLRQKRCHR